MISVNEQDGEREVLIGFQVLFQRRLRPDRPEIARNDHIVAFCKLWIPFGKKFQFCKVMLPVRIARHIDRHIFASLKRLP